jgi:hypothetical protein
MRKEVNMNLSVEPVYTLQGLDLDLMDVGCSNCVQPLAGVQLSRSPVPVSNQQLEGLSDITSSWWFWGVVGLFVGGATYLLLSMLTKKKKEE